MAKTSSLVFVPAMVLLIVLTLATLANAEIFLKPEPPNPPRDPVADRSECHTQFLLCLNSITKRKCEANKK
jgi:hypothetical protein